MRKWRPRCTMAVMKMRCFHSLLWIGRCQLLPSVVSLHQVCTTSCGLLETSDISNMVGLLRSYLVRRIPSLTDFSLRAPLWPGWNFLWTVLKSEIFPDTISPPSVLISQESDLYFILKILLTFPTPPINLLLVWSRLVYFSGTQSSAHKNIQRQFRDLIKLKCFFRAKEAINKIQRVRTEWEKIFENAAIKGLISKIYK